MNKTIPMKNKVMYSIILTFIFGFIFLNINAQSCLSGEGHFTSQAEIDNFQSDYPGCIDIEGDLIIEGNGITNLNGFIVLKSIQGTLWIKHCPDLASFSGLDSIAYIGEDLRIYDNDAFTSLSGLGKLEYIGGRIMIADNALLNSLTGLEKLTETQGLLSINLNNALTDLRGFENLQHIGGTLDINSNDGLTSLEGLENIDTVDGSLWISYNTSLLSLSGLDGLKAVASLTEILGNDSLHSLSGLENLSSIGEEFTLESNTKLTDLTGLSGLKFVGSMFRIWGNDSLVSLAGMTSFDSITNYLMIQKNNKLTSLTGLENVVSMNCLNVSENQSLTSLAGIENVTPNSILCLTVHDNPLLENCDVQSICEFLASPTGTVGIYNNADGCNSPPEIANLCGFVMPCLPFGHYYLRTQQEIDSFQFDYPECHELSGNVSISGNDITNLNGLNVITSIGGILEIIENPNLASLTGLDNLVSVDEILYIRINDLLNDLQGLNGLISLGGHDLWIEGNNNLHSLSGIDSINAQTINFLLIANNPVLSLCDVTGICNFLSVPDAPAQICGNMTGCADEYEVEEACGFVSINEVVNLAQISIFPNPASDKIHIIGKNLSNMEEVNFYNKYGQMILHQDSFKIIDVSNFQPGLYIIEIKFINSIYRTKVIVN
jgi:hypothetical protein